MCSVRRARISNTQTSHSPTADTANICTPKMSFKYIETKPRQSKAQRRRDVKAAKKLEADKRIEEATKLDEHKERREEQQQFNELLSQYNCTLHEIDADGDCLYKAVEHQLSLADDAARKMTFQELREATSSHMLSNKNHFMPFLVTDDGNSMDDSQYESYCNKIAKTKVWGGNLELSAISQIVSKPIHVYQANLEKPIVVSHASCRLSPMHLSFHKHLYKLGEHYNSVVKAKGDQ